MKNNNVIWFEWHIVMNLIQRIVTLRRTFQRLPMTISTLVLFIDKWIIDFECIGRIGFFSIDETWRKLIEEIDWKDKCSCHRNKWKEWRIRFDFQDWINRMLISVWLMMNHFNSISTSFLFYWSNNFFDEILCTYSTWTKRRFSRPNKDDLQSHRKNFYWIVTD
jgi:hypothetical protein